MVLVGESIRTIRKYRRMTQKELGEKIGMSEQAISQYERSEREPSIEVLQKIAQALGTNISFLVEEHKVDSKRIKLLMDKSNLTILELSKNLNIAKEIILEFIEGKKITTNEEKDILYKISDYFQVSDNYLLSETDFKYNEDEEIEGIQSVIEEVILSKNDNIRILARDLFELIHLTIRGGVTGNKEKELSFIKEFYNVIYTLQNRLGNDAYLKCYGNYNVSTIKKEPLSSEDITKLANDSKEKFCNLVDNFVSYYLNLEEWRKDFYFDIDRYIERVSVIDSNDEKQENDNTQ